MPGPLHETLSEEISVDISFQLNTLARGAKGRAAEFARGIDKTGSADVTFNDHADVLQPDKSFSHEDCGFPGLVIEISWSQREKDVVEKARSYLKWSKGEIRTVVGIECGYRRKAPATFTIWHATKDADQPKVVSSSSAPYSGLVSIR